MIRYMLDTNVCIDILRSNSDTLVSCLVARDPEEVAISAIVFAELQFGVCKSSNPSQNLEAVTDFCTPMSILPFDSNAAEHYGRVRTHLQRLGIPIGPLDTLIAAHALAVNAVLVTNNEREFRRVAGLMVENWLE